jgi:hypothetical protein
MKRDRTASRVVLGFAAETHNALSGRAKLRARNFIAVNDVTADGALCRRYQPVALLPAGVESMPLQSKTVVAERLIHVAGRWGTKSSLLLCVRFLCHNVAVARVVRVVGGVPPAGARIGSRQYPASMIRPPTLPGDTP